MLCETCVEPIKHLEAKAKDKEQPSPGDAIYDLIYEIAQDAVSQ